jgi:hypothetical protein
MNQKLRLFGHMSNNTIIVNFVEVNKQQAIIEIYLIGMDWITEIYRR